MRVGELSRRTGASIRSLRYYEECGLLNSDRSASGQRHYTEVAVDRVALIRQLLAAGLGTAVIAEVLPCMADPATQTSLVTARLISERDRLDDEISQRVVTRDALSKIIRTTPELDVEADQLPPEIGQ